MEDWKRIYNKSERKIYMVGDLESYVDNKIKSQDYRKVRDDYVVQCPYCAGDAYKEDTSYEGHPYLKRKLYVYLNKQAGHCFRCGRVFMNLSDKLPETYKLPEYNLNQQDFQLCKLTDEYWNLGLFRYFSEYDERGYQYLITKRHKYMKDLYKILKFRFFGENPVIPFFYKGEFIYYQIKYIKHQHGNLPYFSPPIDYKPPYIIEKSINEKFVICEGVFDAIACLILYPDRTPFALLGSSITDYQIAMLRSYVPQDILVYCDETQLSVRVAEKIMQYINYAQIDIVYSTGMDPEERLKSEMAEI